MANIVISEPMDQAAVEQLATGYQVVFDPELFARPHELRAALAEARALIVRDRTKVDAKLLEASPHLEAIGRLGAGVDNIDLAACEARGIRVLPATGAHDVAVAEYAIGAMLVLLRGVFHATADVLAGKWPRERLIGRELAGKRLGIVGFGSIGRAVARRGLALDMLVSAFDPYSSGDHPAWSEVVRCVTLAALIESADVVSVHAPLTPFTRGLVGSWALGRMKPDAVLINAARGGIVDEAALIEALKAGKLAGAALDVFEQEPLDAAAAAKFKDVPNLILTPHVAGPTRESSVRIAAVTAANVRRVLEGG